MLCCLLAAGGAEYSCTGLGQEAMKECGKEMESENETRL